MHSYLGSCHHFQENKELQNLSHGLEQRLFYLKLFLDPNTLAILAKIAMETEVLPHCLVKHMPSLFDRG